MAEDLELEELERLMAEEESVMDEMEAPELPSSKEIEEEMINARTEATTEAAEYVNALADLYLPEEVLDDEYVIEKIKQDIINLGNCIFNLNQTQNTIVSMQSDIMAGNTHPRTFEVLGQLFKTNMDVMKYKKQYMQILEREYEDFKETFERANESKPRIPQGKMVPQITAGDESTISKGTKGILEEIKQRKENGK